MTDVYMDEESVCAMPRNGDAIDLPLQQQQVLNQILSIDNENAVPKENQAPN